MQWLRRLKRSFGAPFLILITCIYWTQGFRSLPWMGISYQLKDELKLSPAASQFAMTVAFMPWSIKPVYGILSDCVPINGSRRIPYLILSSILSFFPWFLLGAFDTILRSTICMIGLLTIQNIGTAMADVVVDAMIAEAARKERAEYAGDLQSMSWFAMALGGMLGSVTSGFVLSLFHVKGICLLFSVFPLLQVAVCGFVNESKLACRTIVAQPQAEEIVSAELIVKPVVKGGNITNYNCTASQGDRCINQGSGKIQGVYIFSDDIASGAESLGGDHFKSGKEKSNKTTELKQLHQIQGRRRSVNLVSEDDKSISHYYQHTSSKLRETFYKLFQTLRQPAIRKPMLWFFLAQISIPNLSTMMFYYQTNYLHLDASFLGTSRFVGWGALMLGTFLYNQYLKNMPLRKILRWTHFVLAFITLSDVILVRGLHAWFGIPDKLFIVGASALGDAVNQFKFMPFLVLSGQLCEPGVEGTLFALFMSLNNLGGTLSSFLGAALASSLSISADKYQNLVVGICIQSLCTLLPIILLHLVPDHEGGIIGRKFS